MAVHANSVIPLWLQNFNPAFYDSITTKEKWSYDNQTLLAWQPFYTSLAAALDAYKNFNRESEISGFLFNSYGYLVFSTLYGTSNSQKPNMAAAVRYSMNGWIPTLTAAAFDYFNDIVMPVATPDVPAPVATSAKMTAVIAGINAAPAAETAALANLGNATHMTVQRLQVDLLFKDLPIQHGVTKADMRATYFTELGWDKVYTYLNVGSLTIPTSP